MAFSLFVLGFIFLIGLVIGSFLNVVILRTVSGESIVFPASKCPKCQTPLKWYHNIPVLSYIFLRGKCGFCKEHISIQYPIVELLTGILFILLFLKFCNPFDEFFGLNTINSISWEQIAIYITSLIATGLFIAIAGTDIIEKKVSDAHTFSLIGLGLVYSVVSFILRVLSYHNYFGEYPKINGAFFLQHCPILCAIACAIIGFIIMEIVARLGQLIVGTRAFGEGDSFIAAGLGSLFGALFHARMSIVPTHESEAFLFGIYALLSILILSVIVQIFITFPLYVKKLILEKNIMTLGAIAGFILLSIGYFFAMYLGWLDNKPAYIISTIVLAAAGIFACREVLIGIRKNKGENGLYLPFGPAMIIAGLIFMFLIPMS